MVADTGDGTEGDKCRSSHEGNEEAGGNEVAVEVGGYERGEELEWGGTGVVVDRAQWRLIRRSREQEGGVQEGREQELRGEGCKSRRSSNTNQGC